MSRALVERLDKLITYCPFCSAQILPPRYMNVQHSCFTTLEETK